MIRLSDVTFGYAGAASPALVVPSLHVPEGDLVLVVGPTGSGKSTLLRLMNGLVPHLSGGTLAGRVEVAGRDTARHRPRDLADVVGLVQQDPLASFVTDTVEDEIAYGMEVLGVAPSVMRRRVEEILDVLRLHDLRGRALRELSGGQQQRAAIAAVLAAGPRILVLDEPTSALDPVAAEDVLAALRRLVADMALTVVLAEHRLERVVHHADAVVLVEDGHVSEPLPPAEAFARSLVYPPVVGLGRLAGWHPLPLSVRAARRAAGPLRERLVAVTAQPTTARAQPTRAPAPGPADMVGRPTVGHPGHATEASGAPVRPRLRLPRRRPRPAPEPAAVDAPTVQVSGLHVRRGRRQALAGLDLELRPGRVTVLMGRNGSGKSTLLWTLVGHLRPEDGTVRIAGTDPRTLPPHERVGRVGMVPQDPLALLFAESVADECAQADADAGAQPGTTARLLRELTGHVAPARHPRDLSEGQRLALALAVVLSGAPPLLLLDEPTRGLDYAAKGRLVQILSELARGGHTVLAATHDVEFAADVADRVLLLADGAIVADDDSAHVLSDSTAYAPQVARVLAPVPALTVADARATMEALP